ncbi:O-acetyl-ADP-ribose deacetylase [Hoeflea sp. TYP-13]|uniref:O-acetyl-ADP-ribose deacetylase n=1 Tax=Hoeflea sp. TYP-13 TaxID=3230023 RepID=UPI0034C5D76F
MELRLLKTDITALEVDAIVNAANSSLLGGGGVDGAIHRKGGSAILKECRAIISRIGQCAPGSAVITTAGELPARYVIHTVGPVWNGGASDESRILARCYTSSLQLCIDNGIRTVAFPNISTGIYGYPKQQAATTALQAIREFNASGMIDEVLLACFDNENHEIYRKLM